MPKIADAVIKWSFYLLFFLVPLIFFAGSYELFEYNKMMLTYGLTIIIAAAWLTKLISVHKFSIINWLRSIRRTPLDIPIILYLLSHIISTIVSLDPHTSVWGYYSRFHEGLLATFSYIILYYAAVSNLDRKDVLRIIIAFFSSGVIVSVWGALEHFGHSPSCLFITSKFDDDCWIQDVKNRVFATLGQPNWMAAYLDVLTLTVLGFITKHQSNLPAGKAGHQPLIANHSFVYALLLALFFCALLFTKSRSGLLGLAAGLAVLFMALALPNLKNLKKLLFNPILVFSAALLLLSSLVFGLPFSQIEKLNLESFLESRNQKVAVQKPQQPSGYIDIGISESGDIRRIVWKGAIKVWQRYPLFGSGVETFAYAYYKDRPVEHNMVSEWDFLYNKAHNEFLNILATTGTVGMLAYLSIIATFTWWFFRNLMTTNDARSANDHLIPALFAAYISILVTNFFGFSVVIIGLFFFLIPAFCLILANQTSDQSPDPNPITKHQTPINLTGWVAISFITLIGLILELRLTNMWSADKAFAYGKNLDSVQQYTSAYPYLNQAVNSNPDEPTFHDEFSYNQAILAQAIFNQASGSAQEKLNQPIAGSNISANTLLQRATADSNTVIETSPNVLTFWKTRVKVFYTLSSIDRKYIFEALSAIQKAADLAPTDAKVHYNLGLLTAQAGDINLAVKIMEETTVIKPDYSDARYALALYYSELGQKQKAREQMQFILDHIGADDRAKKWLKENE